ncbi:MAG: alpha-amylase family glycosyl hydrolase [Candidatus Krumholzibacteria bacterium]|nr:alpha-amylase family glycosyl hydrolase [Candidatus Krumholzibacteria bacterium]
MTEQILETLLHRYFPFGFQTSFDGWERFGIGRLLAAQEPLSEENLRYTVRRLAEVYNRRPPSRSYPLVPVFAEQWLCLGLINDTLRYVLLHYVLIQRPGILAEGTDWVRQRLGEERIDRLPPAFAALFPPYQVLAAIQPVERWLATGESELPAASRITVETILLYLMMRNPATRPCRELFDDSELQRRASYVPFVVGLEEFFDSQEPSGLVGQTLFRALRAPILASPDDLGGQLAYIRKHWSHILPPALLARLDLMLDLLKEMDLARSPDYGPPPVLEFADADWLHHEPAAFSRDADWMSNVVLIAKSAYVWLDQLSRRYGRDLRTLADIPDAELDRLARWGFTGLWLIGLWQRSAASRKIKQYAGNPEALASAYSLDDYRIADDLGGEEAFNDLRERAWQRGIRLGSDMVPNHMGIDSRWVIQHPQWFLQTSRPPYPAYRFDGGDLCDHPDVEIRLEEGYWRRDDAAVVFQRRDSRSGEVRYIYHGNDGTSMPWNDTAQLDFTQPDVREAVIQTILHVARQFPIIRFDAAMTLAKKHYQRLWFPAPGDAGAIPSRAEYGLSREQFHALMPREFWRDVVDRVAAEVPQTLLLAEAFWLMEGYFVRTLGMHRVYNSAFMNMLKMEENRKYRQTVKNVLEFSPEVLKRFVNFMNNPDERTAVEQFGKGDKYFGVAVLMVTMPGLPMFGHGQIEGFAEKYGMEYRRAYWDEPVDEGMVRRHERDVFPLMRRRALFSSAENFAFFDFVTPEGRVDENVFAYTNRHGNDRALILYNNRYESTRGGIHTSTAINAAAADQAPYLVRRTLAEALALDTASGAYYAFRDFVSGLEYLRSGEELARFGLRAELNGYQYQTFLDWRHLHDADGRWQALHAHLQGRPVASLRRSRREMELAPLIATLAAVTGETAWHSLLTGAVEALARQCHQTLIIAGELAAGDPRPAPTAAELADELAEIAAIAAAAFADAGREVSPTDPPPEQHAAVAALYAAWLQRHLAAMMGAAVPPEPGAAAPPPRQVCHHLTGDDLAIFQDQVRRGCGAVLPPTEQRELVLAVADLLTRHDNLLGPRPRPALQRLFTDRSAQYFLQANQFADVWYFSKERAELLLDWAAIALPVLDAVTRKQAAAAATALKALAAAAGYRQQDMLDRLAEKVPNRGARNGDEHA